MFSSANITIIVIIATRRNIMTNKLSNKTESWNYSTGAIYILSEAASPLLSFRIRRKRRKRTAVAFFVDTTPMCLTSK